MKDPTVSFNHYFFHRLVVEFHQVPVMNIIAHPFFSRWTIVNKATENIFVHLPVNMSTHSRRVYA